MHKLLEISSFLLQLDFLAFLLLTTLVFLRKKEEVPNQWFFFSDSMYNRTSVSLLNNRVQHRQALHTLFTQLQFSGHNTTQYILSSVLKSCAKLEALPQGKQAHCVILKNGFNTDVVLMTSLLHMYSKCTVIQDAYQVFDEMPNRDPIATNGMISGLCRSGFTLDAIQLFQTMHERDVGSWNSLISGLAWNAEGDKSLSLFRIMRFEGVQVDELTMVSIISVCADLATLGNGKLVHGLVIKYGFVLYVPIGNAMVDMYAKCGCMDDACLCFHTVPWKNVLSWTSLIMGFGKHGLGLEALKAFHQMRIEGVLPNKLTFLGVLFACSHAGLVQEGWRCFNTMIHTYSLQPMMEHYTCMVDLLARSGLLVDAITFIETLPVEPDGKLWTALLSSCCSYKNVELVMYVGEKLLELKPEEAGPYMLLSNFYGVVGNLEGVAKVRKLMIDRGIRKVKACTWVEINNTVHTFESGDRSHPHYKYIYSYLKDLIQRMKGFGYVPNISLVAQNVDNITKEEILLGHSEKLAIGLALISTPPGTQITIIKNLRICTDCHVAAKLISKIEGTKIVARDSNRFHRFVNGVCSCGDKW